MEIEKFVLAIGCARSGTSMIGAILDSHPQMICGHETEGSKRLWHGMTREDIVSDISTNSRTYASQNRPSEGYVYGIESEPKVDVKVLADKIWNPAMLLLSARIPVLREVVGAPVALVHCLRNPFDVIATMHRRSGAPLADRARFYFMHCDAAQMLYDRGHAITEIRSCALIANPREEARRVFEFLDCTTDDAHLDRIAQVVHSESNQSRHLVEWPQDLIAQIERRTKYYSFLEGYGFA